MRFRQEPRAVMADVQAMFHQVKVDEQHLDFLRFLWWPEGNLEQELVQYRMHVHLFGAVSSRVACYALRKAADDNAHKFSAEVTDTVKCNFYIDDLLKSLPSEEGAILMIQDLKAICQTGGFNLTKWFSNSCEVLSVIPEEHKSKNFQDLHLDRDKLPCERALGLNWCVETDSFKFKFNIKDKPQTRRRLLSTISSVYDPLGFLASFTIPAKRILQDLCRLKCGWNELIPQLYQQKWNKWLENLKKVENFKINLCLKPQNYLYLLISSCRMIRTKSILLR